MWASWKKTRPTRLTRKPPTETSISLSVEMSGGSRTRSMDSRMISVATKTRKMAFTYPESTSYRPYLQDKRGISLRNCLQILNEEDRGMSATTMEHLCLGHLKILRSEAGTWKTLLSDRHLSRAFKEAGLLTHMDTWQRTAAVRCRKRTGQSRVQRSQKACGRRPI